jgi:hypothetical protein
MENAYVHRQLIMVELHDFVLVSEAKSFPESRLYAFVQDLARYPRRSSGQPIVACSRIAFLSSLQTSGGRVRLITSRGEFSGSTDSWRRTDISMLVIVSGVMLMIVSFRVV